MDLDSRVLRGAERRIAGWILGLGAAGSVLAVARGGSRAAVGIALGTVLAWIHFRWLRHSVARLETLATGQAASGVKPQVQRGLRARLLAGYALLLAGVCASFFFSSIPAAAVVTGLLTLVGAVLAECVYQLSRGCRESSE